MTKNEKIAMKNFLNKEINLSEYATKSSDFLRLKDEEEAKRKILSKEEVEQLREGLTKKWQAYNFRYANITHKKLFDNLVLLRK